ncbi:nitroreductase family deazaflavin-dependent oxidoreductase [Allosaccharopolyspora coralli]|uniref:Nitroreductase family deazaflavin-dependent oxidoreductase n=2 Tax=Allosaccharopolyspora coralli TaxID=2665642 RepID=A0A5Q3QKT8_9PSEU|nr:nitroreductase family deazaflavin-dependent oxidoreductase [Allosaccharopolyspora coralli]
MKVIGGHGGTPRHDTDSGNTDVSLPSELAALALRTRSLARSPITLYRSGFGRLLGSRMMMLEHTGRRSGQQRFVCLEVVERPAPNRLVIVSGFGERSQWFRNLQAHPACFVSTGGRDRVPATARMLSEDESAAALRRYQQAHPRAWKHLRGAIESTVGVPVNQLPMVELRLQE